jgi:hypothetical protein
MNTNTALSQYDQQVVDFLAKTNATIEIKFLKNGKHFDSDIDNRDIYEITIKRGTRSMKFNFGQSIVKSTKYVEKNPNIKREYTTNGSPLAGNYRVTEKYLNKFCKVVKGTPPSEYSILACLTKYNPGTFEDFCSEFGYDTDSRKAEKTYQAVVKEYLELTSLFNEAEIEELQEIN